MNGRSLRVAGYRAVGAFQAGTFRRSSLAGLAMVIESGQGNQPHPQAHRRRHGFHQIRIARCRMASP
jgi:hypothetical protein